MTLAYPKQKRQARSARRLTKPRRVRLPEYVAWLANNVHECQSCGTHLRLEIAHLNLGTKGLGSRSSEVGLLRLCWKCHQGYSGLDRIGNAKFEAIHEVCPYRTALENWARYLEETAE